MPAGSNDDPEAVDDGLGIEHAGLRAAERTVRPVRLGRAQDVDLSGRHAGARCGVAHDRAEDVIRAITGQGHNGMDVGGRVITRAS